MKRKEKDLLREALLAEVNSGIKPDIFCGIAIDQFTPTQKVLFDKLSAREIKKLSQSITINKAQ